MPRRERERDRGEQGALIVDAGPLYAYVDAADPDHEAVLELLSEWPGAMIVPAFVATEADYLVRTRLGVEAELRLLEDLARTFAVESLDAAGILAAREICAQYRDLGIGLADASLVVLAERWATATLATLDERHFRAISPLHGHAFRLLPSDD